MTKDEKSKCRAIIHSATAATAAIGGFSLIPVADTAPITAIQIGMVISLGAVFGQEITKTAATSIVGGFASSLVGRGISQLLVGWIPIAGQIINGTTAAGITETLGWTVANQFAKSGTEAEEGDSDDDKGSSDDEA